MFKLYNVDTEELLGTYNDIVDAIEAEAYYLNCGLDVKLFDESVYRPI